VEAEALGVEAEAVDELAAFTSLFNTHKPNHPDSYCNSQSFFQTPLHSHRPNVNSVARFIKHSYSLLSFNDYHFLRSSFCDFLHDCW